MPIIAATALAFRRGASAAVPPGGEDFLEVMVDRASY
jgi:hypothetical protein